MGRAPAHWDLLMRLSATATRVQGTVPRGDGRLEGEPRRGERGRDGEALGSGRFVRHCLALEPHIIYQREILPEKEFSRADHPENPVGGLRGRLA